MERSNKEKASSHAVLTTLHKGKCALVNKQTPTHQHVLSTCSILASVPLEKKKGLSHRFLLLSAGGCVQRKVDAMWQPLKINSGPWGPRPPINLPMTMAASYSVTDALEMDRLRVTWIILGKTGARSECGKVEKWPTGPVSVNPEEWPVKAVEERVSSESRLDVANAERAEL